MRAIRCRTAVLIAALLIAPVAGSLGAEERFENGSAIVAGRGIVSGTDEQGPYTLEYQSTNVLIKRDGTWRAVASHVSGIKRVDA
jgi:hypothetical protein